MKKSRFKYKFREKNGIVKIKSNLRIRKIPATENNTPLYEILYNPAKYQNVLNFVGWVENGQPVHGNSKWYQDGNGNYFWSGNVTNLASESVRKSSKGGDIPNFVKGKPNSGTSKVAQKVREVIDHEFRFETPFERTNLQCTEYAQFRALQKLGHKIDWGAHKSGRNGGRWWRILKQLEYTVSDTPRNDSLMSFTTGFKTPEGNRIGHVAFVEKVNNNGSIKISEANWDLQGGYSTRFLEKEEWKSKWRGKFVYII